MKVAKSNLNFTSCLVLLASKKDVPNRAAIACQALNGTIDVSGTRMPVGCECYECSPIIFRRVPFFCEDKDRKFVRRHSEIRMIGCFKSHDLDSAAPQ
jgi:hypothetical protein